MVDPRVIAYLFPVAKSLRDYIVTDNGSGPTITFWNAASIGQAQPSAQTIATAEASPEFAAWLAEHGSDLVLTARRLAKEALDRQASEQELLLRATVLALLDEINALRGQIIGVATAVWDPANMANAAGVTSPNVTVTGAAFGDCVDVCAPYSLSGIVATAYVSAADTVNVRLHNGTGGAVNLASGTWKVVVRRHVAMPDRTAVQARAAIKAKATAGDADT